MATVAARGSGTPATTGTTWAAVTNAVDGTAGTNPATYATMTNATASAVATVEVTGYDFASSVAAVDTLNSVTVAVRHFENNTGRFASVRFQPYDGATAIGSIFTATMATGARTDTTTFPVTLAQLRSATFKIRVTVTGAASTQSRVFSLDQVDVTADYTPLPPAVTQAAYRWFDEGTEAGAVALAAQDSPATGDVTINDGIGQLRVRLQSTNTVAPAATDDWQLQWEKNSSGTWANVATEWASYYDETNYSSGNAFGPGNTNVLFGQSFLGNGGKLVQVGWWGVRLGNPTGNTEVRVYAHTGTFGAGGIPTGTALATSTPKDITTIQPSVFAWVDYDFDGTFTLENGTPYFLTWHSTPTGTVGNNLSVGSDTSAPTSPGNAARSTDGTSWITSTSDLLHRVRTLASTAVGYASPNLTDGEATTNRLGAGSGSFVAGKVSEDGLVDNVGWSANNYTELLWSLALQKANLANGDTLRFRVLRNGATTGLTYTQTPTINILAAVSGTATGGLVVDGSASGQRDVTGVAVGSVDVAGTAVGVVTPSSTAVTGTATGTLTLTSSTTGVRATSGTATGSLTVTGTASGQVITTGLASGTVALSGTAAGQVAVTATATGQVQVVGAASGLKAGAVTATASGSLSVGGVASGVKSVRGTATGQVVLTSVALGQVEGNAVGRAVGVLSVTGFATGLRGARGVATGTLTLVGLSVGRVNRPVTGHAAGILTLGGVVLGRRGTWGTAAGHVVIVGTARGSGPEVVIGMWDGAEFVTMLYGDAEVVDWVLT